MPIRTASLNRRIEKNGAALHREMLIRIHSQGADHAPSEAEQALLDERQHLKEEKAKRRADAEQPKAKADKLVRTHHALAKEKEKPKAKKEKEAKPAAKGHKPTRAEKHATKAAALEAAKRAAKKSAKT
ncbi:MAG TPA: hypothetical protein VF169_12435 [Albitalea sp.]|uniref:hypothetical protein n=1 Tax=Piscinibacter sp. TaxID=1903157 RepID=UPI002ED05255